SLVVLTGFAGQVSLGQFAFVGLGALVGGRMHELGYPPWTACLYAVMAGGLAALIVGIPALRIRGLFLAVTTLAFAVAMPAWPSASPSPPRSGPSCRWPWSAWSSSAVSPPSPARGRAPSG